MAPEQSYDRLSIGLHWAVALLVAIIGALGLLFSTSRLLKPLLLNLHALLGLVLIALVLVRIWHRLRRWAPNPIPGTGRVMSRLAAVMHVLLYGMMVVIPALGLVSFIWHGRAFDLGFGRFTPLAIADKAIYHPTQVAHIWLSYAFMAAIGLHVSAAAWHHLVRRDATLRRMIPGLSARA